MRGRVVLAVLASALFAAVGVPALAQQGGPAAIVTPSIQITQDVTPGRMWVVPQMLVDPKDPNILVISAVDFNKATCHAYVSRDRGRTWAKTPAEVVPPGYKSCVRPNFGAFFASKFGVDGTLYMAGTAAATATNAGPNDPFIARSTDLGQTWQYTVLKKSEELDFKKPDGTTAKDFERFGYVRIAVHPTNPKIISVGYRRQGAFLPVAQVSERTMVAISTDGGATFGPLTDIFESTFPLTDVKGTDQPGMAWSADGTLYAFTKERPPLGAGGPAQGELAVPPDPAIACRPSSANPASPTWVPTPPTSTPPVAGQAGAGARLLMSKSDDMGKTWKAKVADSSGIVCVPCLTTPEAAVDPKTGEVYVVWEQSDSGPPGPRDDRNIWLMHSSDKGETFTKRQMLNDDLDARRNAQNPNYDQMFPGIDIAPNGRVDVAWWDFRTDALYNSGGNGNTTRRDATCFDIYYTSSSDRGETWAKNSRISDRSMNQWEGLAMNPLYDLRGPVGVASTNETAYVAWSDSRAGSFQLPTEDVYMATVVHEEKGLNATAADDSGVDARSLVLGIAMGMAIFGVILFLLSRNRPSPMGPPAAT